MIIILTISWPVNHHHNASQSTGCVRTDLQGSLSVQAHFRHCNQHLVNDQVRLSLRLHLLTLGYELHNTNTQQIYIIYTHVITQSVCTVFVHIYRALIRQHCDFESSFGR